MQSLTRIDFAQARAWHVYVEGCYSYQQWLAAQVGPQISTWRRLVRWLAS